MIVSHAHRFILVKTRKTAGSSVELALSPHLGPGDLATPLRPEEEARRNAPPGLRIATPLVMTRRFYPWPLKTHAPLWQAHDWIGRGAGAYRVVSLCRNPWDKAVSHFFWSCRDRNVRALDFDAQRQAFIDFTRTKGPRRWFDRLTGRMPPKALDGNWRLYQIDGAPRLDFVIRYEYLAEDLAALGPWLGLDRPVTLVGIKAKSGLRPGDTRHWSDYYDATTRDLVAHYSGPEIDFFGYDFPGSAQPRGPILTPTSHQPVVPA
ncbi:MAG: hypothetical protein JJT81_04450 [Rubellimicrobium sp.]|nr:hypothetical protein [Rubellimicrobium sp.]